MEIGYMLASDGGKEMEKLNGIYFGNNNIGREDRERRIQKCPVSSSNGIILREGLLCRQRFE